MQFDAFGKILMALGAIAFVLGVVFYALSRLGVGASLGRLPGDLSWRVGNGSVYVPIVTSIVISVALTIVANLLLRWFR